MPRPTIDQIRAAGDWATTVDWNLQFVKFPNAVSGAPSSDDINLRCESSDIPRMDGQSTEVMIRGMRVRQPGLYLPSGQLNLAMVEGVDNKISTFIRNWREACFQNKTGIQNKKSDVEATIRLVRLDRQQNEIWEYIITGCFLEGYDPGGQLQGQSADALRPQMTLSFDYFEDKPL